jgi:hypothetical protein
MEFTDITKDEVSCHVTSRMLDEGVDKALKADYVDVVALVDMNKNGVSTC